MSLMGMCFSTKLKPSQGTEEHEEDHEGDHEDDDQNKTKLKPSQGTEEHEEDQLKPWSARSPHQRQRIYILSTISI